MGSHGKQGGTGKQIISINRMSFGSSSVDRILVLIEIEPGKYWKKLEISSLRSGRHEVLIKLSRLVVIMFPGLFYQASTEKCVLFTSFIHVRGGLLLINVVLVPSSMFVFHPL